MVSEEKSRRIQDMLLTINNSISDKAPPAIRDLITLRSTKYDLRHDYILSLSKVNTTKYGLKSWRYFAAKIWNELTNDIRIISGTNEVKTKSDRLSFDCHQNNFFFIRFLVLSFYSFYTMNCCSFFSWPWITLSANPTLDKVSLSLSNDRT